jgi:hypothetical protein
MTRITLDASLANRLHGVCEPVELCDPAGTVLGRFLPAVDTSDWEPMIPEASEAELDRREWSQEKRYSTVEVLAYLESR